MARIIAGRFDTQAEADRAIDALKAAGFQPDEYTCFYLSPAGQHASYPIGGDAHHDEGTKESGKRAAAVAAVGSVTGLAVGTVTGAALGEPGLTAAAAIAGAGIGGYVGALAGGLTGSRSGDPQQATPEEPVERAAGMMVAVRTERAGTEAQAVDVLRAAGAIEVERAEGTWREGTWVDFNPTRTPELIGPGAGQGPQGPAGPRP
ncbi:MAG: hypothetical protein ACXWCY_22400 [Burkholderiales bacterium]